MEEGNWIQSPTPSKSDLIMTNCDHEKTKTKRDNTESSNDLKPYKKNWRLIRTIENRSC